ncbi:MAG: T9SS type A sorting domain-containing protein [Ignavibacteriaceae bacterium]|nr:T9SS type A sorting domain-containing protein [Ignavibacteriaceae bacterium]
MKKIFFIILLITACISPQKFSVHKEHYLQYGSPLKLPSEFDARGNDIIPLQYDKSRQTNTVIFGYLPDWEYGPSRQYLRYDILTHIGAFDFTVSATGAVGNPSGWPWTDVINTAHQNGVKVILTAVNFDGDQIHTIMTDPTVKQTFFNNIKSRIQQYQLDGVNIDFESLNSADRGTVLNTFMAELSVYLKSFFPNTEVSFAGPALTSGYNLSGLASSCDYIFIMGYAFWGSWSSTSGACSPLTGGSINITNTVVTQYSWMTNNTPQKLILGIPYYGLKWKTQTDAPHSPVIDYISSSRFKTDVTAAQTYGRLWASDQQVPWYRYQINNEWYQVWYDDDSSLGLKYALAQSKNYLGVGMWALGYDGDRQELWNELYNRFYATVPVELSSFTLKQFGSSVLLNWKTATETNSRLYTIERSAVNRDAEYTVIGTVDGAGTTVTARHYTFTDDPGTFGNYIYRITQHDFDGTARVIGTEMIRLIPDKLSYALHDAYPNPFNPSVKISFSVPQSTRVTLSVYNQLGELVSLLRDEPMEAGEYEEYFTPIGLPAGVYILTMQSPLGAISKKLVYLK